MNSFRKWLSALALISLSIVDHSRADDGLLPPGFRPLPPGVHALVGGKVVVKPGETLDSATIIIRDGFIEKVGKDIAPPADARIWNMQGMTVYAGFIDPYLKISAVGETAAPAKKRIDLTAGRFYGVPGSEIDPGKPGAGSGISVVNPQHRVAETYSPDDKNLEKMRELGFTAANIVPEKGIFRGTSAFAQLSDSNPNYAILKADVFEHIALTPEGNKEDAYPVSLMGAIATIRQTIFDAQHYAADWQDYKKHPTRKRPDFNPALEGLQPVIEQKLPVMFEPEGALMVDRAARVGRELKLKFSMVATGQEWRRPALAKETKATFVVPLDFPELPKMPTDGDWEQISLDQLRAWDWAPEDATVLRQQGLEVALTTYGLEEKAKFRKNLKGAIDRGLSEKDALAALTTVPAKLCGVDKKLGTIEPGKLANLTVVDGKGYFDPEAKVREVWIDGESYHTDFEPAKEAKAKKDKEEKKDAAKDKNEAEKKEALKKRVARSPLAGRGPITNPPSIYLHGATVWTCASNYTPQVMSLLIQNGKIQQIGNFKAELSANTLDIDATGMHITPGIIDCHSHAAILGDVNEGSIPSTAMVRIGDVVNSDTENLYDELAGGLTVANLLHGSANPIGGQNQVIKLRDGASPEGLKFAEAPAGIKFALGENVKQSNWGEKYTTRFPQTRMGVRTFYQNRFIAAQQYLKKWDDYKKNGGLAPRRDLELEAIGEILQGKRWIHCHSYRQDEILMLLRLMQSFNVQIGTFQHVLEGYKVADELAAGHVGASTFADWWAYKFEVYDAIPYNGSLMHDRGVLVSFNSDSPDLARRLNFEAAKAVKFGGTPEVEALKFVTLNPAKQLRIDKYVGSLEVGKDADFVIWAKSPLDSATICLQTWIEGRKYFDREQDVQRTAALQKERAAILEKAKKILGVEGGGDTKSPQVQKFFARSMEHRYDGKTRHCEGDIE